MAERDRGKMLARLHRVRSIQLDIVRAAEADAHDRVASEAALRNRIATLAAGVAPQPSAAGGSDLHGVSFAAAALYRARLQVSAQAAEARVVHATARVEQASAATRAAHQDRHAIEKLIEREDAAAALKAVRALEVAPPSRAVRHDPC